MRELRFRAWYNNKMVGPFTLHDYVYDQDSEYVDPGEHEFPNEEAVKKGAVIMQPTGLRDRHGKEVWEGDLVVIYHVYDQRIQRKANTVYEVYWNEDRAGWGLKTKDDEDYDNGDYYHGDDLPWESSGYTVEVIGNCFEHPTLLRATELKE